MNVRQIVEVTAHASQPTILNANQAGKYRHIARTSAPIRTRNRRVTIKAERKFNCFPTPKAYNLGARAHRRGRPLESCRFKDEYDLDQWMKGWLDAYYRKHHRRAPGEGWVYSPR